MFKDLNRFEKYFLICGLIVNIVTAVLSKSDLLAVICAICSLFNAVYVAKGSIVSYLFGFVATIAYIWISFSQHYYSEMIVNIIVLGDHGLRFLELAEEPQRRKRPHYDPKPVKERDLSEFPFSDPSVSGLLYDLRSF